MNDLDARIRTAVTELADAAPAPKPLSATSADGDRSRRWMAIAAASVLIVAGIVAIATWQSTRDEAVPVDTVDTTTPGVTLPPTPPPTDAVAPVTTAPSTAVRTIPVGQITARPDDVLAVDADGALVLIGIDGDAIAPPVTLVAAPADPTSQHIEVAGLVDGTVLYGVTGASTTAVMAVTAPGAEPTELARASGGPWVSPDGEQWALVDPSSGRLVIQRTDGSPGANVMAGGSGSVAWSPDGTSLYVTESDSGLAWLRRYSVDDGYAMTGKIERYRQGIQVAGFDGSGNLVVSGFTPADSETTVVDTVDPVSLEAVGGAWDRTISPYVTRLTLSPDGSRMLTVAIDGGATIEGLDGVTVSIDGVSAAWFAGAVTTGAPTPPPQLELGVVVDGPVVTLSTDDGVMDGRVGGVLTYDGTCLSLVEPGTGARTPVVWREGTTWDASAFRVVLPGGRTVALGDQVEAGGGSVPAAGLSAALHDAIGSCAIGESVAIVQSAETVTPLTFPVTTGESPPLPTGELAVGPDDVVATRPDGTLWWYPAQLGDAPGEPVRLVELGDPSVAVEEGPGPNVVDAVAGVVDGTLVFGECCEPVAGAVSALTTPGAQRDGIGFGSYPVLHPTLPRLATVSPFGLTVTDLATATAASAAFDTDPTVARSQVAWAGNSGESLIVLGWDEAGWRLEAFRPDDLSRRILVRPLGLASPVSSTDPVNVSIAGIDRGWNLILAITDASGTRLQAIDPDDLVQSTPNPWNTTLPATARNVHLAPDNRVLWIEGDALMTWTGVGEPQAVATGVVEGWFATQTVPSTD